MVALFALSALALFSLALAFNCGSGNLRTEIRRVSLLYCLVPPLCVPIDVDWRAHAEGTGHGHANSNPNDGIPDGARSSHLHRYDQGHEIVNYTSLDDIPVPVQRSFGTNVFNTDDELVFELGFICGGPGIGGDDCIGWGFNDDCSWFQGDLLKCSGWEGLKQLGRRGGWGRWSAAIALLGNILPATDSIERTWSMSCSSCGP